MEITVDEIKRLRAEGKNREAEKLLAEFREQGRKNFAEIKKKDHNYRNRVFYKQRKERGMCAICGENPLSIKSIYRCDKCIIEGRK